MDNHLDRLQQLVQEARRVLPPWEEVRAEAQERADHVQIGRTLFARHYDVTSEAQYKRQAKASGRIMTHTHIGLNSWPETKDALLYLYDGMAKRGQVVDRFGLCLDRVMAYPPQMRDRVIRETGPQLKSVEDWVEVGQVVPIQPHAGDFMIGFPASMFNTECALRAGITTIGNVSQYFAHGAPEWSDHVATAVETAKAIAMMGFLSDQGTLVHSYLDDGFGSLFTDYANIAGWAYLERYMVEELLGAKLAHCFGGVTVEPMMRVAWVFFMRELHGEDCLGSMWYGDTISFSPWDYDRNLGLNAEYLLWDIMAQLACPTGHAVLPLPVTEASRIPSADAILQAHVIGRRVEESARRLAPHVNLDPARAICQRLVRAGKLVFEQAVAGLRGAGADVTNPLEIMFVLRQFGPQQFEEVFGAGAPDPAWPRGRKPEQLTDIFAKSYRTSEDLIGTLHGARLSRQKILLAGTDVHEHALFIIQRVAEAANLSTVLAGTERNPVQIVAAAQEASVQAIVVATYNGMALEVGRALRREMDRVGLRVPVFMGGRLNQAVEGQALPVDVARDVADLGIVPCPTIPDLLNQLEDLG